MTCTAPPQTRYRTGPLVALACASFVYVTSETLPIGLLPQISGGLSVTEGRAGLLLTVYAFIAGATAIPFTAWTTHVPRQRLVLAVMAVFAISQFAAALAPNYWWLVGARIVCALGHGLFWSIVAPIAARLAPPGHQGRATAIVFVGTSLALVGGLPLTTLLGELTGWRWAFAVTGAAGAFTWLALRRLVPPLAGDEDAQPSSALARRLVSRPLVAVYTLTAVVVIGQFAAYSYLAPLAREHGGFHGPAYSALLLGYGGAGLLTVVTLGRIVDHRPRATFVGPMVTIVAAVGVLGAVDRNGLVTVLAVIAWGGAFAAVPLMLQAAVLRVGKDPDVASAVYVVAFQIGIGGGAALGGALVDGGHLDVVTAIATACAAVGLGIGLGVRALFPRGEVALPRQ
jgi:predicted MFS family arabinose efflux permease